MCVCVYVHMCVCICGGDASRGWERYLCDDSGGLEWIIMQVGTAKSLSFFSFIHDASYSSYVSLSRVPSVSPQQLILQEIFLFSFHDPPDTPDINAFMKMNEMLSVTLRFDQLIKHGLNCSSQLSYSGMIRVTVCMNDGGRKPLTAEFCASWSNN